MKKVVYFIMASFTFLIGKGQSTTFEGGIISQGEVPEMVLGSQVDNFGDTKVVRWKRQRSTGRKGNGLTRYIAVMKEGKRPLSNARYSPVGEILYYAEYYGHKTIPDFLSADLKQNFVGHKATGGTHIKLYRSKKEYYRIRLKKGSAITYVFYDENGNQVDRNQLPESANF
ncbi:MAG: hypothetical protein AAF039_17195 [Bacteroidota bacterium]